MIKKIFLLNTVFIFIFFITIICNSCKNESRITNNKNEAVKIAVKDFIKKNTLAKENTVFNVKIYDPLSKKKLVDISESEQRWINSGIYEDLIVVNIFGDDYYKNKYNTQSNLNEDIIPNQFIEINGKLFLWKDKDETNKETTQILKKYGVLTNSNIIPVFFRDDAKKGTDYFFCKNNLRKYKGTNSNIATGYLKPPNIDCK